MHTVEPIVPDSSAFEFEVAVETQKTPGTDQIPPELIKAAGRTIRSLIQKILINFWNKDEFFEEWKESIVVPI